MEQALKQADMQKLAVKQTEETKWKDKEQKLLANIETLEQKLDKVEHERNTVTYLATKKQNQVQILTASSKSPKVVVKQKVGSVLTVKATAYTAQCDGCSGVTRTGIDVRASTPDIIAVDPDVIDLNREVELIVDGKSWGIWETQDIGSDIKGLRIDILMSTTDKANDFGVKEVTLKVVK